LTIKRQEKLCLSNTRRKTIQPCVGPDGTEIFGIVKRDSFGSHGVVRHPLYRRLNRESTCGRLVSWL